jgi:uncharacterized protein (TIGR02452 family)
MATDYAIYSPRVPDFRQWIELPDQPYDAGIITAAALNRSAVGRYVPERLPEVARVFELRIEKVLAIGAFQRTRRYCPRRMGCGAFGNASSDVAPLFGVMLQSFGGAYEEDRLRRAR